MVFTKYVVYLYSDNNNEAVIVKLKIMKTIKMYTSENVTANSGKILTSTKEITMLGKLFIQLEMKKKMN